MVLLAGMGRQGVPGDVRGRYIVWRAWLELTRRKVVSLRADKSCDGCVCKFELASSLPQWRHQVPEPGWLTETLGYVIYLNM